LKINFDIWEILILNDQNWNHLFVWLLVGINFNSKMKAWDNKMKNENNKSNIVFQSSLIVV
jgi:hypothetical protein